jgi:methionyl-tRNA formyltransferase
VTGERVRTVFIGSGGFGRESLRCLAEHAEVDLVGVVTAPARPAGRGGDLTPTPIREEAQALGIPAILTPERLRAAASVDAVLPLRPALVVLADYGQIVPAELLGPAHGALNLHPSLLPRHRGATPIPAAILAGDVETGVTLMRMDPGLDTGPIVAQERVALDGTETTPDLEAALAIVAAGLLDRELGPWIRGETTAMPQSETEATLTRPFRREDGRLDPSRPAADLARAIRAYRPWPGTFVDTTLGRLTILTGDATAGQGTNPGRLDPTGLQTVDGTLRFGEVLVRLPPRPPGDPRERRRPCRVTALR